MRGLRAFLASLAIVVVVVAVGRAIFGHAEERFNQKSCSAPIMPTRTHNDGKISPLHHLVTAFVGRLSREKHAMNIITNRMTVETNAFIIIYLVGFCFWIRFFSLFSRGRRALTRKFSGYGTDSNHIRSVASLQVSMKWQNFCTDNFQQIPAQCSFNNGYCVCCALCCTSTHHKHTHTGLADEL